MILYSADFEDMYSKGLYDDEESKESEKPKSMLNKIIKQGFDMLDLINFFTFGEIEVRAWTI